MKIFEYKGISVETTEISSSELSVMAERPAYSVLATKKISRYFNININQWEDSLRACTDFYNKKYG